MCFLNISAFIPFMNVKILLQWIFFVAAPIKSATGVSVIVQIIIYHCSFPLRRHLKTSFLAKSGEGIVNVQFASLHCGPQGAKAWWSSRDVDIVMIIGWWVWMWVRMWGNWRLLLLWRRCTSRSPGSRGDTTRWWRHLVVCRKTRRVLLCKNSLIWQHCFILNQYHVNLGFVVL